MNHWLIVYSIMLVIAGVLIHMSVQNYVNQRLSKVVIEVPKDFCPPCPDCICDRKENPQE